MSTEHIIKLTESQAEDLLFSLSDYMDRVQQYIHDLEDSPDSVPDPDQAIDEEMHIKAAAEDLWSHIESEIDQRGNQ